MTNDSRVIPLRPPDVENRPPVFERIAVVGLGLIGGSIALAARRAWPSALVIGVDRKPVLERAMLRHAMDVASEDRMIASEADLVILAAPIRQNLELLSTLADTLVGEAVITDVGSTKRSIVEAAAALPARLTFVGGHPLAGGTTGGIDAAREDMFSGRPWLFVPTGDGQSEAVGRLSVFVEGLGAQPRVLASAAAHDHLVALLSHLPQLTVSALMSAVGERVGEDDLALAGRGLIDTTRLAASPADIWCDVCATNQDEIGPALDVLIELLSALRARLDDAEAVEKLFSSANRWRAALTDRRPS
ncbi:MAG TPA: prephenate dehydrogenase/arogenate dehydrogenase family protein [Vicinamibacterales bacterium]|jgi:prephenate dehydrogenase